MASSDGCKIKDVPDTGGGSRAETLIAEELREKWEREQNELKSKMIKANSESWESSDDFDGLEYIGGVDLSFVKGDDVNACASLIVCSYPELKVVYSDCTMVQLTAPYIPGFLAFREVEFLADCVHRLRKKKPEVSPQVILVDGNGLLHPKKFGLACHLGVVTDIPCIGVAKKLFQVDGLEKNSTHLEKIGQLKNGGDTFPLVGDSGQVLGMTLRSCNKSTNPVYVSIGHRIALETAVRLVHRCCKYRIPEPIRQFISSHKPPKMGYSSPRGLATLDIPADIQSREYLRQNFHSSNADED
ncbi:endonuclease V-like isoform X2 [Ptychodera flava]|uniref:endonuclease V-like isoform X2 n=1 Tax=Ptychodera flava TaxID=63121 RepID=UPI003969C8AF